ncbi:MAG: hypothetical protein JF615_03880 [Asticcacaulis sp.]|nr:hypothetical protein [Asticcacaulis sp.]
MAMPRLLPIVFVAVGGVLALKALTSLEIVPDVFHKAEAFAADTAKKTAPKKDAKAAASEVSKTDDPSEAFPLTAEDEASDAATSASAVPAAPVCATSINQLAQDAGMSPNELQLLQSLGQRRKELDQRETNLNSREALINAADAKLDNRINQLQDLKNQVQGLLDQATKAQDDDTNRLVAVYTAMKPKDAAAVFATMDDEVRLPIAARMKDRALAAILGAMPAPAAKDLTEKLARRMSAAGGLQQQLNKATANGGGQTPAATAPAPAVGAKPAAGTAASGTPKK